MAEQPLACAPTMIQWDREHEPRNKARTKQKHESEKMFNGRGAYEHRYPYNG